MDLLNSLKNLEVQLELLVEQQELRDLGLTDEEIEGYIDFYWNSWFSLNQEIVH